MKCLQQFKDELVWLAFYIDFAFCLATGSHVGYIKTQKHPTIWFRITFSGNIAGINLGWNCFTLEDLNNKIRTWKYLICWELTGSACLPLNKGFDFNVIKYICMLHLFKHIRATEDKGPGLMESNLEKQAVHNGLFQRIGLVKLSVKFQESPSISIYVVPFNSPAMLR